ncbi:hypothetical protein [Streptomyces sp. CB01201]|uniref:hypothetical protein n=1 Tax=Streptomyces sp. CB01201 TaxID=2020324 RepID=UPI00131D4F0F|nr:hypothetical protein [Streptomyces sp. CB01201]
MRMHLREQTYQLNGHGDQFVAQCFCRCLVEERENVLLKEPRQDLRQIGTVPVAGEALKHTGQCVKAPHVPVLNFRGAHPLPRGSALWVPVRILPGNRWQRATSSLRF